MKTKELIRQLQKADPTGELECCIYNEDIECVIPNLAYYDGPLQILHRNEQGDFTGATITTRGTKINLYPIGVKVLLEEMQFGNFNVELDMEDGWIKHNPYRNWLENNMAYISPKRNYKNEDKTDIR